MNEHFAIITCAYNGIDSIFLIFQNVLSYVSKQTKAVLSRVGVFTVTSFHALVCARSPLSATAVYSSNKKKGGGILSTFKADTVTSRIRSRSPVNMSTSLQQQSSQRYALSALQLSFA